VGGSSGFAGILTFGEEEAWWRSMGIEEEREIGRQSSIVEVDVEDTRDTSGGACVIVVVGLRERSGSTCPATTLRVVERPPDSRCGGSHLVAYCG
jgi:hypothetical protein